jgi:choice-of-anchor B domain-containing protein
MVPMVGGVVGVLGCAQPVRAVACENNAAAGYPCDNIDLAAYIPLSELGANNGSSATVVGWTHESSGREFALLGMHNGTAVVEVTVPNQPRYVARIPAGDDWVFSESLWRELEVYNDFAIIVSEANGHSMVSVDLRPALDVANDRAPIELLPAAIYSGGPAEALPAPDLFAELHPEDPLWFQQRASGTDTNAKKAHTVDVNVETGYAYLFGSNTCNGGPHIVDIRDPERPQYVGCFGNQGYTHDGHCRIYRGPDLEHVGKEICFLAQGEIYVELDIDNRVAILDVTDKSDPKLLSFFTYEGAHYTHQGALTDDERFLLVDDELDEAELLQPMRTLVFDISDLDDPQPVGVHVHPLTSIDHNQHVVGNFVVQADYTAGVRVFALDAVADASLIPVGHFDVMPHTDAPVFEGTWNVFPYFASGTMVANSIFDGLFVLTPRINGYDVGTRRDD